MIFLLGFYMTLAFGSPSHASTQKAPVHVGGKVTFTAEVNESEESGVSLVIKNKIVGELKFDDLGSELVPVQVEGKNSSLTVLDFDKDGNDEVIVRSTEEPAHGMLYVFIWNKEKSKYEYSLYEGEEFVSVDIAAPVKISREGELKFSALETTNDEGERKMVDHVLRWKSGHFAKP